MMQFFQVWSKGLWRDHPIFVLMLGLTPALSTTADASSALAMGISVSIVLVLSELLVSFLRDILSPRTRLPIYLVILATIVTCEELFLEAFGILLSENLGIYLSLNAVNALVLSRCEIFAANHHPLLAFADGIGMSIGYTAAMVLLGVFRECLGKGSIFGCAVLRNGAAPVPFFSTAPGAFFALAFVAFVFQLLYHPTVPKHITPDAEGSESAQQTEDGEEA